MKQTRKEMLPGNFISINNINYFRLENGNVAVDNVKEVIIKSSKTDLVELVTLEKGDLKTSFWLVSKNELYALANKVSIKLPENFNLDQIFDTKDYDGVYVKYSVDGSCGILYISETEVSIVIDHNTNSYKEITFEGDCFLCRNINDKYDFVNQASSKVASFDFKCKKARGFNLFYTDNELIIGETTVKVEEKIKLVEVLSINKTNLIKVTTNQGIYLYTSDFEKIGGLIEDYKIEKFKEVERKTGLNHYIFGMQDNKVILVCYIGDKKEDIKSIYDKDGIDVTKKEVNYKTNVILFFSKKVGLYINKLTKLFTNIDDYIIESQEYCDPIILGYKSGKINNYCKYDADCDEIRQMEKLEFMCRGIDYDENTKANIFKLDDNIICMTEKGKILFKTEGDKCTIRKRISDRGEVYLIEKDDKIALFSARGNRG